MALLRVGAEQVRRELADLLARVGYAGDRVIAERHGTPQAVLIPYPLYEQFTTWLEEADTRSPTEFVLHFAPTLVLAASSEHLPLCLPKQAAIFSSSPLDALGNQP